jgi:ribonuclease HI
MAKKKIYVVAKGKKPGIYTAWAGKGQAQEQVTGQGGAVYKSFSSAGPAVEWLETVEGHHPALMTELKKLPGASRRSEVLRVPDGDVAIYTDGACSGNPGPGGYGCVILHGDQRVELSAGFNLTTNNRMEILACIAGIEAIAEMGETRATLVTDSRYVVNAVTKGWAKKWRSRRWMRTDIEPAKNPDLWERMLDLLDANDVRFRWVKGHAGHADNERCDELAVAAAAGSDLPPDAGFRDDKPLTLF